MYCNMVYRQEISKLIFPVVTDLAMVRYFWRKTANLFCNKYKIDKFIDLKFLTIQLRVSIRVEKLKLENNRRKIISVLVGENVQNCVKKEKNIQ